MINNGYDDPEYDEKIGSVVRKLDKIKKVTYGFVVQEYDEISGKFVEQYFTPFKKCSGSLISHSWHNESGVSVKAPLKENSFPFEMVQPSDFDSGDLEKFIIFLKDQGIDEEGESMDFDDLTITIKEDEASDVNNKGFKEQVKYFLKYHGNLEAAMKEIHRIIKC